MNLFSMISAAVVAISTSYTIYLVYRHKKNLTNLPGIMISMVIAVITGLLSGSIIGFISGEMFLVIGSSMILGFIIGFLAGHPIGILAILMGSISGLIGGIMGGILGVFLQFINPTILLGILLGFYIIIIGFVIAYIFVETNDKFTLDPQELSPFAIIGGGIVLLSLFLFMYSSDLVNVPSKNDTANAQTQENAQVSSSQPTKQTEEDVTDQKTPVVKMLVSEQGYSPNVIRVKKGIPVTLEIQNPLENNSCLSTFMIPDFNINNVNLKFGTTTLSFTPDKTGEYTFSCGMKMFKGTIIVK